MTYHQTTVYHRCTRWSDTNAWPSPVTDKVCCNTYTLQNCNALYLNYIGNAHNNCCSYLCFVHKLRHRVQTEKNIKECLVEYIAFDEKKIMKTINDENLEMGIFCTFFNTNLVDVRQSKSLSTRIPRFSILMSFRFQCNTCFNKYTTACIANSVSAIILLPILYKLQLWYPCYNKLHKLPYLAFATTYLSNNVQPPIYRQGQIGHYGTAQGTETL